MNDFLTCVWDHFATWETRFCKKVRDRSYSGLAGFDFKHELTGDEAQEQFERAERQLEAQVHFIRLMVAFRMIDGPTAATLTAIKQLLKHQQIGAPATAFTFTFQGGCSDGAQTIHVEEWDEFDFADVWAELRFTMITIEATRWKEWTKLRIEKVIKYIRESFAFDGMKAKISIGSPRKREPIGRTLFLDCRVR